MARYREILSVPGALYIFLSVALLRFATIATDFAVFWLLAKQESYASGALGMGAIYLGIALLGPLGGRIADRFGVKPVLRITGISFLLVCLLVVQSSGALMILLLFLLGATRPAGQGFGRASWQILYPDEERRLAAASLDSIQSGTINGLSALVVSGASQIIAPENILLAAGSLACLGALLLSQSSIAKELLAKQKKSAKRSLWRRPGFIPLLLTQALFFAADGFLIIALLVFSAREGASALGGVFLFVFLLGSVYGTYKFGLEAASNLDHRKTISRLLPRYILLLALLVLGVVHIWLLLLLLPLAGFARRGFTPSMQTLLQEISPLRHLNQALALLYLALVLGSAFGRSAFPPLDQGEIYLAIPSLAVLLAWICFTGVKQKDAIPDK